MRNINRSILKLLLFIVALGIENSQAQNAPDSGTGDSGTGGTFLLVIVGIVILTFLYFLLKKLGFFGIKGAVETPVSQPATSPDDLSGEINAAILLALHLYENELHDQEDPVITMIRVSRTYSPWSSKIYGLRKLPR